MHPRHIRFVKFVILCLFVCLVWRVFVRSGKTEGHRIEQDSIFQEIVKTLEPFEIRLPNFVDDEARRWFYNSTYYRINCKRCRNSNCEENGVLFNETSEHLLYRIAFVKNGLYLNDDCGYNYGDVQVRRVFKTSKETTHMFDKLIILTVPEGWAFQHFFDGMGPKLSHSAYLLQEHRDAKILVHGSLAFDRSVKEIWVMLGVDSSRLVDHVQTMRVGARLLINPCRTAAIHPVLWNKARELYWKISNLSYPFDNEKRLNLIYIKRTPTNTRNNAENALNYIEYDHSTDINHIRHRVELFVNARIVIAVHGGALSNMNFAQPNTTIIEIMPYQSSTSYLPLTCATSDPNDLRACAGYILYIQSQLLNHQYWMLPVTSDVNGNIHMNMTRWRRVLRVI